MGVIDWHSVTPDWLNDTLVQGILTTDTDLVIRGWNRWLEQYSGLRAETVIGRPLLEVFPDLVARRLDVCYQQALHGQVVPVTQRHHGYLLAFPPPDSAAPFASMPQRARIGPLVVDEAIVGTISVIDDVSERALHDITLRQIIQRQQETVTLLHTLLENVPIGFAFLDTELRFQIVNTRMAEMNGRPVEEHLGRALNDVLPGLGPQLEPHYRQVLATGEPRLDFELSAERNESRGRQSHWLVSYYPVRMPDAGLFGVGTVVTEVTNSRRAESTQRLLAEVSSILAASLDYAATLQEVARLLVPHLADLCVIEIHDSDTSFRHVAAVHADPQKAELMRALGHYPADARRLPPSMQDARNGAPVFLPTISVDDLAAVAYDAEHLRILHALAPTTAVIIPLRARDRALGVITFAMTAPGRHFGPDEVKLAVETARRCALAMDNAQLYHELQTAIQRKDESLALLDTLLDKAPVGLAYMDPELRFLRLNDCLAAINGVPAEQHIGRTGQEIIPQLMDALLPMMRRVLATGEPQLDIEIDGETPAAPGKRRHWLASYYPVQTPDGRTLGIGSVVSEITDRKRNEEMMRFLAEISTSLTATLDYEATLHHLAHLVVPYLADWCVIDMASDDLVDRPIVVAHADPEKARLAEDLQRRYRPDLKQASHYTDIFAAGRSLLMPMLPETLYASFAQDAEHLRLIQAMHPTSYMIVPLVIGGSTRGTLALAITESQRRFDAADLALAEEVAQRAALALENARLYAAEQRARAAAEAAAARTARLQAVTAALSRVLTPQEIGTIAVSECVRALDAQAGSLLMVSEDETDYELLSSFALEPELETAWQRLPASDALLSEVVSPRAIFALESLQSQPQHAQLAALMRTHGYAAFAAIPLLIEQRAIGVLTFHYRTARTFNAEDHAFMTALGQQCTQALERTRLYEAERSARAIAESVQRWLVFLAEATTAMASSLDYKTTIEHVLRLATPTFADFCVVNLIEATGLVRPIAVAAVPKDARLIHDLITRYPMRTNDAGVVPQVLRSGESAFYEEISDEWLLAGARDAEQQRLLQALHLTSYICVPILLGDTVLGALTWASTQARRRYRHDDLSMAEELARRIALSIDNARLYAAERHSRQNAEQAAERTTRLQAITAALGEALTPAQVGEIIVQQGMEAMGASAALVALLTPDGSALEMLRAFGYGHEAEQGTLRFPLDIASPVTDAVHVGNIVVIETAAARARLYPQLAAIDADLGGKALAAMPLFTKGRVVGVLGLSFAAFRHFTPEDLAFMRALAQQCAQALERTRLYEGEQHARAVAEEAVRVRDAFFSIAAHELRTPLTSLLGQAQLLQRRILRKPDGDERDQRSVQVIIEQSGRLNKMMGALLDVSRIATGRLSIERVPMDLTALVRRVLDEVRPTLHQHRLEYTFPATPLVIVGDELRLEQVIQNVLGNAVKYSPQGGRVTVIVEQRDAHAWISVQDQGIGIPATAIERLFQRFYRAANADLRRISGMGIGLYVVKEIVDQHGGTITVESTEGVGSTFTITLPLPEDASQAPGAEAPG